MDPLFKHLKDREISKPVAGAKPDRRQERGEYFRYFMSKLNPGRAADGLPLITEGRLGKIFQGVPTTDLYYVQKECDRAPHWSKKFWFVVNPEKFKDRPKPWEKKTE